LLTIPQRHPSWKRYYRLLSCLW